MNHPAIDLESKVFMTAPIGLAIINSVTGTIMRVNDAYCAMLGRPRDCLVGKTWMQFTHPDDLIRDVYFIYKMRDTGESQMDRTKRYLRPDGAVVHATVTATPLGKAGADDAHMVMIQDVSANIHLKDELRTRKSELRMTREEMLNALVIVAKFRDRETGGHLQRIRKYVEILLCSLARSHPFSSHGIRLISHAAMLHDIGKIGIPDSILLKKGSLDDVEFSVMKTHTTLGSAAMLESMRHIRGDSSLMYAREIAEAHHERWDGTGYPHGISGRDIPLTARVLAVADVYDALISNRPYKEALPHADAVRIVSEGSGSHFDPEVVDGFLANEKEFARVSEAIADD